MASIDSIVFDVSRLTEARLALFMTRADLAKAASVSCATVWAAHTGKKIGLRRAKQIARGLRVDVGLLCQSISAGGRNSTAFSQKASA